MIVVEDTAEVQLHGPNDLGLIAVKGELGEALINTDDLLQAALRLRPDRILLGELRGKEAVSFLRAVNTGHPGSFSTIHANSTSGALEQLALMVMQSGLGLSRSETIDYARSVMDVVVQLGREGAAAQDRRDRRAQPGDVRCRAGGAPDFEPRRLIVVATSSGALAHEARAIDQPNKRCARR